jgi:hypothetical protein
MLVTYMSLMLVVNTTRAGGPPQGRGGGPAMLPGPAPTYADLDYAPAEPATSNGHKLDLYIPAGATGPLPATVKKGRRVSSE